MNHFYLLLNRQENYQTWRLIVTWHYRYIPSGRSHHDGCRRYGTKSLWKKSMVLALCAGNSPVAKARVAELWCFLWSRLEQTLSKHSARRWFEKPSHSLWSHCNAQPPCWHRKLTKCHSNRITQHGDCVKYNTFTLREEGLDRMKFTLSNDKR